MNSRAWLFALSLTALAAAGLARQDPPPVPKQDPVPPAQGERDPDARAIERIEKLAKQALEAGELTGLAIVVARGTEPILARGFGYADAADAAAVTEDTMFRLGPPSRLFTNVAALQLVQAKKLALDDEVSKLVPEFPTQGHKLTVQHLLSHTSGIPPPKDLPEGWHQRGRKNTSVAELLAPFADRSFEFEPGERFSPNDSNTTLLSVIVERASGVAFNEYVEKNLLLPLGLRRTHLCDALPEPAVAEPIDANAPKKPEEGEQKAPEEEQDVEPADDEPRAYPLGLAQRGSTQDLCSSAMDLLLWQRALVDRSALDDESARSLSAPIKLENGTEIPHGYGLSTFQADGVPVLAHCPREEDCRACISYYPTADLTVVVLANTDEVNASELERAIARAVLDLPEPGIVDLEMTPEERAVYLGAYQIGTTRVVLVEHENRLVLERPDMPDLPLQFQGRHTFVAKDEPETVFVFSVENDRATEFVMRRKGFETIGKRFE